MITGIVTKDFVFGEKTLHRGDPVIVLQEGIVAPDFIKGASACAYACKYEYIKSIVEEHFTAIVADIKARDSLLKYMWHAREGEVSTQFEPEVEKLLAMYDAKVKEAADIIISKAGHIFTIPETIPEMKVRVGIPVTESEEGEH